MKGNRERRGRKYEEQQGGGGVGLETNRERREENLYSRETLLDTF